MAKKRRQPNKLIQRLQFVLTGKGLYDLHPELLERVPILREYAGGETASSTDSKAQSEYYGTNVWVHKAVRVWADNIAPLSVRVVRGMGNDIEPLEKHPMTLLLDNPNPTQSATEFWREFCTEMALTGEFGAEVVRGNSKINELWPRQSYNYQVQVANARYRQVKAYRIEDNNGDPYSMPPEEFVQFKFYNPLNVWRGIAPLTAVKLGVAIDELAQVWTRLFFKNQARPDYAVIAPEGITKTERDEIMQQLMVDYMGAQNAHKPIVLERGVTDIKTFSFAPKDLEWLEQRRFSRDEVGAVFGVPDEIMGYGKDTFENFDAADRVLWTLTLSNIIQLRDDTLTRWMRQNKFLKPGERIETDLSMVPQLQEDKSEKIKQLDILAGRGYPVNVVNAWMGLGLPDVEGGDVGYLPMGVAPVAQVLMPPEPAPDMTPEDDESDQDDQMRRLFGVKNKMIAPVYGSPMHEAILAKAYRRVDSFVDEMQRIVKREFQRQQNDVARKLRAGKDIGRGQHVVTKENIVPVSQLFDYDAEVEALIKALREVVTEAVNVVGQATIAEVIAGGLFDVTDPLVKAAIDEILRAVSRKVNDTTWTGLIGLFQEAEEAGEGIPAIQERLSAFFGDRKSDWQTERIARTTMTGASNNATLEGWRQTGQVAKKTWISALQPNRTRDAHAAAHGQTVGLQEAFTVDGERLMYPGDPQGAPGNIINCLCVMIAELVPLE